jgi:hypothetical protein
VLGERRAGECRGVQATGLPLIALASVMSASKSRGEGMRMTYGIHPTAFGEALLIATERALAGLAFVNDDAGAKDTLAAMRRPWPEATFLSAPQATAPYAGASSRAPSAARSRCG